MHEVQGIMGASLPTVCLGTLKYKHFLVVDRTSHGGHAARPDYPVAPWVCVWVYTASRMLPLEHAAHKLSYPSSSPSRAEALCLGVTFAHSNVPRLRVCPHSSAYIPPCIPACSIHSALPRVLGLVPRSPQATLFMVMFSTATPFGIGLGMMLHIVLSGMPHSEPLGWGHTARAAANPLPPTGRSFGSKGGTEQG